VTQNLVALDSKDRRAEGAGKGAAVQQFDLAERRIAGRRRRSEGTR